jgi:hypothetical protein
MSRKCWHFLIHWGIGWYLENKLQKLAEIEFLYKKSVHFLYFFIKIVICLCVIQKLYIPLHF